MAERTAPSKRTPRLRSVTAVGQGAEDELTRLPPLSIWGGVECTHNRVGDTCFDQMELSGYACRQSDIEAIASLGIRTLRLGLLWERFERDHSWAWTDQQLRSMVSHGIQPIAGLLHHGSGPLQTSLLAPEFPQQLADYASAVAQRYPELEAYTPVNEPNTTARFSGQYGLWYPHHRSAESFVRALLNQVKGTVLSMQAIRHVRPDAKLIQTDDAGCIRATRELKHTADLLNERQWLTFDLLSGRVDRHHPMFEYLQRHGISEAEIFWFRDHPCPPDVVGLNYYVTSDRFLDHRVDQYPCEFISSEGPFVDAEAVRVHGASTVDFAGPLREAWRRYALPVALTEVHLGGHPDEQIRWLAAAFRAMRQAQQAGVQCAGLTVWALLGSWYWNELVTRNNGHYEPGVFDSSSGELREASLAEVVAQLARGEEPHHPALEQPGWWVRPERTYYPWVKQQLAEVAA